MAMPKNKVLVVDDEPTIRYTLGEALKGWGYEHLEAGTIAKALEFFESEHPLVVLQDIHLPDGSGLSRCSMYYMQITVPRLLSPGSPARYISETVEI